MASSATETGKPSKPTAENIPESPTTARPLEMDDDDVQDTSIVANDATATPTKTAAVARPTAPEDQPPAGEAHNAAPTEPEAPPAKPPRPMSEAQKNEIILKEAFPSVDQGVIKAVLRASGGNVEPAFNALLEMTDPDAAKNEPEEQPPARPPRPQGQAPISQVEADELYARQLAEHYDNVGAYEARTSSLNRGGRSGHPEDDDREHSFLDDDLPVIRENLRKGFLDTQTKVNGWIAGIRKKLEDSFDETEERTQSEGQPFRRQGEASRRSGDYDRYDADPQVLSDDFAGMRFSSDGHPTNHPLSNQGLHRPPPPSKSPRPDGRRVGFKEGHEEINMYDSSPKVPPKDNPAAAPGKASKWQPLSTVEPEPITDNDPFSLGDSEDEKEAKETKPKDIKEDKAGSATKVDDAAERVKKATAEAMADSLGESIKAEETGDKKN
ncbi:UBA-like protein [Cordyceps fumosorosea ARSEF 2679]|uniref:UBA-like protein n=1 Tax=Cordyceps fumosorosea (strain ARSEF 2679) TaxID=1081104 RepID=A0A162LJ54_CORFA|nr:UBA-like protein [Cordyceps fumosorosea ARSEF 2679]OAA71254.1 UBA-like protein [Cordyceps fumosorosea ARSEF 2679]